MYLGRSTCGTVCIGVVIEAHPIKIPASTTRIEQQRSVRMEASMQQALGSAHSPDGP